MELAGGGRTGYGNNVLLNNGSGAQVIGGTQVSTNLCNGVPYP